MNRQARTVALVVAAGSGSRAGGDRPKQYRPVGGKPLLRVAVEHLLRASVDEVRVVIGAGHEALYREAVQGLPLGPAVPGGATRQASVRSGLTAIGAAGGTERVLIHDAARPFLPSIVVDRLREALETAPGAVPALPVVDSLALANGRLGEPASREGLVRVQTPQAFRFDAILAAHRAWQGKLEATDDAQVARAAGLEVQVVEGSPSLEKLTYREDFEAAERRMAAGLVTHTGMGFDVHAFAEGEELWLGGVPIPHSKGLKGHSDADVALHAITDAVLGAIGAGDIGDHFPPSDPQWRGAPSRTFLAHARSLVEARGGRIDHVDVTVICEAPRIGPYREAIRETIAEIVGLPVSAVSVKATTTERLGFTGRGEGMAAQAVATVRVPEIP